MSSVSLGPVLAKSAWGPYRLAVPDDRDEIRDMPEEEVVLAALKVNVFGPNVDKREKYDALYDRAVEIWGEYPESAVGQYATRSFWSAREIPNVSIADVLYDRKRLKERHFEFWEARSRRRRERLHERVDRFDSLEDVPDGLHDYLLALFDRDPGGAAENVE